MSAQRPLYREDDAERARQLLRFQGRRVVITHNPERSATSQLRAERTGVLVAVGMVMSNTYVTAAVLNVGRDVSLIIPSSQIESVRPA